MALHHKLCHAVGGSFDLQHAETHTIILPHAVAYNARSAPEAISALETVFGKDVPGGMFEFVRGLGPRQALRDIGMPGGVVGSVVDRVLAKPYWNPRPLERDALIELLNRAYEGLSPVR